MYRLHYFLLFIITLSQIAFSIDNTTDEWKQKSQNFKYDVLIKDLIKSDYNQLRSLAMSLGLKDETDANAYRLAIADYYKVKLIDKSTNKKSDNKIYIKKAGELKMVKVANENEENLHIFGKAQLVLESKDAQGLTQTRTIEADEIFINTKNKEITGIGNVKFKDEKLEYSGTQFYYNYDLSRGILFNGRTQLLKGGDSGLEGAFFEGDKVVQTSKDDITLHNGMLTTCKEYNPHYYLKVSRLWLSGKEEWGILNGVVYVGQIPFFWIPFYYHPKNLNINPSFGFRSREGWFLNTTYFVLGKKYTVVSENKGQTSAKSLVSLVRNTPPAEGLYSIKNSTIEKILNDNFYNKYTFYKKYPQFKIYPKLNSLDFSLRFFGDAYTNLGFYLGTFYYMNASIPNYPFQIYLLSDVGFSRKIWKDPNADLYVPYNPNDKPPNNTSSLVYTAQGQSTNTYYFLQNNPLTTRSSQWFKITGSLFNKEYLDLNYNLQIEYATDKSYFRDFYNRALDFTYIDLLADVMSYGVRSQSQTMTSFSTIKERQTQNDYDTTTSFIDLSIAPKKYPDIFGLKPISAVSLTAKTSVNFLGTTITKYSSTENDVQDPKKDRYLLTSFSAPTVNFTMSGTLLDYNIFSKMPENAKIYKNNLKNKSDIKQDNIQKDLYIYMNSVKNLDPSTDKTELDYKLLVPLFSKKIPPIESVNNINDKYRFNQVISGFEKNYFAKTDLTSDTTTDINNTIANTTYKDITQIQQISTRLTYQDINPLSFNLSYSITDSLINNFDFDTNYNTNRFNKLIDDQSHDLHDLDSVQMLFSGKISALDIIKRLNINNNFSVTLNGSLKIMEKASGSLWQMSPKIAMNYIQDYDDLNLFKRYLYNISDTTPDEDSIRNSITARFKENLNNTNISIYYTDSIVNDLSFGVYRIAGTQILTNLKLRIFQYNAKKYYNFETLKKINIDNPNFDQSELEFADLYDNRIKYEKIEQFDTSFSFKYNCLPEFSPHKLSFEIGPKINWIIPTSVINQMKTELWNQYGGDVTTDNYSWLDSEARDYIYYRQNGPNINNKISEFYQYNNFWDGPKYYRKMFENFFLNINYNYTYKSINIATITNSLVFVLDNIGYFSDLYGSPTFGMYPNDTLSISFFNSLITYSMGITFSKIDNTVRYPALSESDEKLDAYKIITMTNSHSLTLTIPGTLFEVKLPQGNWLSFSTTLNFVWDRLTNSKRDPSSDRIVSIWNDQSTNNYFYLSSQTIKLSLLMDIITISLNFSKFNFQNTGYGFELDSGQILIGHNITEIPVFWRYFKLTINPSIGYIFTVKHKNYYDDSSILREYNPSFYSNNSLLFNFEINLLIGDGEKFMTKIGFKMVSENKKMYKYYTDNGIQTFFTDLGNSFGFNYDAATNRVVYDIQYRRSSPFKLTSIQVVLEHLLCDWKLSFKYIGSPVLDENINRYNWENTFEFSVSWNELGKNQLMKMFNKTKIDEKYDKGQWQQPILSLDPSEQ